MKYAVILILVCLLILPSALYMLVDYIKPLQKFFCKIGWHCHKKIIFIIALMVLLHIASVNGVVTKAW